MELPRENYFHRSQSALQRRISNRYLVICKTATEPANRTLAWRSTAISNLHFEELQAVVSRTAF